MHTYIRTPLPCGGPAIGTISVPVSVRSLPTTRRLTPGRRLCRLKSSRKIITCTSPARRSRPVGCIWNILAVAGTGISLARDLGWVGSRTYRRERQFFKDATVMDWR